MLNNYADSLMIPSLKNCMDLVNKENSPFFYTTDIIDGETIQSFNYRYSVFDSFNQKYARNLRGIGFKEDGTLLYLPMWKFFNYGENDFTDKDVVNSWGQPKYITEKVDGSLIIFFMLNGKIYCRTQGSMNSIQAIQAMKLAQNNTELMFYIEMMLKNNFTPMFEYISPENTIVVNYTKEELIFLGARDMILGTFVTPRDIVIRGCCDSINIGVKSVQYYDYTLENIIDICNTSKENREGFVLIFNNCEMVKLKLNQYLEIHRIRGNGICDTKYVAESLFNGTLDDVKAKLMLNETVNKELIDHIIKIETKIMDAYNDNITKAKYYYLNNFNLSRKEFAIKAKTELSPIVFSLAMNLYQSDIDYDKYNQFFLRNKMWETSSN